jgi:hypothetical protein
MEFVLKPDEHRAGAPKKVVPRAVSARIQEDFKARKAVQSVPWVRRRRSAATAAAAGQVWAPGSPAALTILCLAALTARATLARNTLPLRRRQAPAAVPPAPNDKPRPPFWDPKYHGQEAFGNFNPRVPRPTVLAKARRAARRGWTDGAAAVLPLPIAPWPSPNSQRPS